MAATAAMASAAESMRGNMMPWGAEIEHTMHALAGHFDSTLHDAPPPPPAARGLQLRQARRVRRPPPCSRSISAPVITGVGHQFGNRRRSERKGNSPVPPRRAPTVGENSGRRILGHGGPWEAWSWDFPYLPGACRPGCSQSFRCGVLGPPQYNATRLISQTTILVERLCSTARHSGRGFFAQTSRFQDNVRMSVEVRPHT